MIRTYVCVHISVSSCVLLLVVLTVSPFPYSCPWQLGNHWCYVRVCAHTYSTYVGVLSRVLLLVAPTLPPSPTPVHDNWIITDQLVIHTYVCVHIGVPSRVLLLVAPTPPPSPSPVHDNWVITDQLVIRMCVST